jgi:tetratricopeptide (TPR) repeat protein
VDLEPQDAKGYLRAAKAMAALKRPTQAVALCRQAALIEPNVADAYANALVYAQDLKDDQAMAWAASNLLRQDWPVDNDDLHNQAKAKVADLVRQLNQGRPDDAARLVTATQQVKERDLVIRLNWEGAADFDLKVKEPIGTVCSYLHRQTPGGGTLLGDDLSKLGQKQYVAAEAFSGDYALTVERVWGRPVGAKVTVEVIRHQGTARERVEYHTVVFDKSNTLTVALADGRRATLATVPPPAAVKESERVDKIGTPDQVLNKLRALSDTGFTEMSGVRGGMASTGSTARSAVKNGMQPTVAADARQATYQKVQSFVNNAVDMTAQTTVLPEKGEIRMKLDPVFQTAGQGRPATATALIPGGF